MTLSELREVNALMARRHRLKIKLSLAVTAGSNTIWVYTELKSIELRLMGFGIDLKETSSGYSPEVA